MDQERPALRADHAKRQRRRLSTEAPAPARSAGAIAPSPVVMTAACTVAPECATLATRRAARWWSRMTPPESTVLLATTGFCGRELCTRSRSGQPSLHGRIDGMCRAAGLRPGAGASGSARDRAGWRRRGADASGCIRHRGRLRAVRIFGTCCWTTACTIRPAAKRRFRRTFHLPKWPPRAAMPRRLKPNDLAQIAELAEAARAARWSRALRACSSAPARRRFAAASP